MKPLGFTLRRMRGLLDATDRPDVLDGDDAPGTGARAVLPERAREDRQAVAEQVGKPRVRPARAEGFAATPDARLDRGAPAVRP